MRCPSLLLATSLVLAAAAGHAADAVRVSAGDFLASSVPAVETLLREAGFEPRTQLLPAARSLALLQAGEVDLEFFRQEGAVAPFREQVRLIGPLSCSINLAFVAKRDPRPVNGLADLRGRRIGILIGNVLATRTLEQAGLPFEALGQRKALFQMLDLGRLDVVIEPERSGLTGLQESGLGEKLEQRGAPLTNIPNYLVLRHRLDDWGPRLQQAASKAVESGRWQQWMGEQNAKAGIPRGAGLGCLPAPKR